MNETTKEILNLDPKSIGDTHFGTAWQDFIEIAREYGFKSGFCQKFTGIGPSDQGCTEYTEEEEIIFFHEEKGLILYVESLFNRNFVNNATVYGEVKIDETLTRKQRDALSPLSGCSCSDNGNGTMSFNVNLQTGFHSHLDAISEAFEFSKTWMKVPFMWFLNHMDTKKKKYDYKEISLQKIEASTPEVRKIIFG